MEINFQMLLDQFKGNLIFTRLDDEVQVTPDEYLYRIETNEGTYYIYEVDFISSFRDITDFLTREIGYYRYLVEVKQPREKFEDSVPYKVSKTYEQPKDFEDIKQYANDMYGSFEGYFSFLVKA